MGFLRICPRCKYENSETAEHCQNCGYIFYLAEDKIYEEDQYLQSYYKIEKSNLFGIINDTSIKSYWMCFKSLIHQISNFRRIKEKRLRNNELKSQFFEPKLSVVRYPYYYLKILFIFIFIFAISVLMKNIPITYLSLSIIVPIVLLWLFFELSKNIIQISGMDIIKAFILGGFGSIGFAILVYKYINVQDYNFWIFLLLAFIEELSKLLLCIFFIRKIKAINLITAILIGFSVGAGFSFLETSRYALYEYSDSAITVDSIMIVFLRSIYGFFGIGHHYWTGILSGALVFFAYDNVAIQKKVSILDIFRLKYLFWLIIFVLIHSVFNYYESIFLRFSLGVIVLFIFFRFYLTALFSKKIYGNPNRLIYNS